MVTAQGHIIEVTEHNEPELFWGLRGKLINFQGSQTAPQEVAKVWEPQVHSRLVDLNHTWDPDGRFALATR